MHPTPPRAEQPGRQWLHFLRVHGRQVHHQDGPTQGGGVLEEIVARLLHEPAPEPEDAAAQIFWALLLSGFYF